MVTVERVFDAKIVHAVLRDRVVLRSLRHDDFVDGEYPIHDAIIYAGGFVRGKIAGIGVFTRFSPIVLQGHIAMLKEFYQYTDDFYRGAIKFLRENTSAAKIIGFTPSYNKAAIACNSRNGFKKEGMCKNSIRKDGVLRDQVIFGMEL